MCQQCNNALIAAATAANLLAKAAETLHGINDHKNSTILAKAAGELFAEPEKAIAEAPGPEPKAEKPTASDGGTTELSRARAALNESLPEGMYLGEDNVLYSSGKAIGQAVLIRRPAQS